MRRNACLVLGQESMVEELTSLRNKTTYYFNLHITLLSKVVSLYPEMNATLRLNQRNCSVDSGQHLNLQLLKGQKISIIGVLIHQWKINDFIMEKKILITLLRKLYQY